MCIADVGWSCCSLLPVHVRNTLCQAYTHKRGNFVPGIDIFIENIFKDS